MGFPRAWQPWAAYLYVLQLDPPGIAWEYLRRNAAYHDDWRRAACGTFDASHWGLSVAEDPALDARDARPVWRVGRHPRVRLVPHADSAARRFDLWAIPGRKTLTHDDRNLWLHGVSGRELVALALSDELEDDAPYAYALPAGTGQSDYGLALEAVIGLLQCPQGATRLALERPPRSALIHMRALQALDGALAGVSQRDIAAELFGEERAVEGWSPDGELRAQVRYLVQRGRVLMDGEYRTLLA